MSILSTVLTHIPDNWEECEYTNVRFKRFQLSPHTDEYNEIRQLVKRQYHQNAVIERIQNPYQYGRFLISKAQISGQGNQVREVRCFKTIPEEKIDILCEYNYDIRRIQNVSGYDLVFSTTCETSYNSGPVVVVFKVLSKSLNAGSYISCTRDSEFYPEYIVH